MPFFPKYSCPSLYRNGRIFWAQSLIQRPVFISMFSIANVLAFSCCTPRIMCFIHIGIFVYSDVRMRVGILDSCCLRRRPLLHMANRTMVPVAPWLPPLDSLMQTFPSHWRIESYTATTVCHVCHPFLLLGGSYALRLHNSGNVLNHPNIVNQLSFILYIEHRRYQNTHPSTQRSSPGYIDLSTNLGRRGNS